MKKYEICKGKYDKNFDKCYGTFEKIAQKLYNTNLEHFTEYNGFDYDYGKRYLLGHDEINITISREIWVRFSINIYLEKSKNNGYYIYPEIILITPFIDYILDDLKNLEKHLKEELEYFYDQYPKETKKRDFNKDFKKLVTKSKKLLNKDLKIIEKVLQESEKLYENMETNGILKFSEFKQINESKKYDYDKFLQLLEKKIVENKTIKLIKDITKIDITDILLEKYKSDQNFKHFFEKNQFKNFAKWLSVIDIVDLLKSSIDDKSAKYFYGNYTKEFKNAIEIVKKRRGYKLPKNEINDKIKITQNYVEYLFVKIFLSNELPNILKNI